MDELFDMNTRKGRRRSFLASITKEGDFAQTDDELIWLVTEAGFKATKDIVRGDLKLLGIERVKTWGRF